MACCVVVVVVVVVGRLMMRKSNPSKGGAKTRYLYKIPLARHTYTHTERERVCVAGSIPQP